MTRICGQSLAVGVLQNFLLVCDSCGRQTSQSICRQCVDWVVPVRVSEPLVQGLNGPGVPQLAPLILRVAGRKGNQTHEKVFVLFCIGILLSPPAPAQPETPVPPVPPHENMLLLVV